MSIEKYTTEGLILKSYEQKENDLVFKIWTREFGIIFCLATAIRKIQAKLRMKMQVNRLVIITIVRGKEIWRLTGAEEILIFHSESNSNKKILDSENLNYFFSLENMLEKNSIISECVNRFLPIEKSHKKLFDKLKNILVLPDLDLNNFRALIYFIVLVETGYADALMIGAKDLEEYINFSAVDLHINFILHEKVVKDHLRKVLQESML